MTLSPRMLGTLAIVLLAAVAAPGRRPGRPGRAAGPRRGHARPHGPAGGDRARAQDHGRDLRRRAEPEERAARPAGRVGPARRPVQARSRPHALRAPDHGGQGRPPHRAVRHRLDPLGHGSRAALRQAPGAPHLRHPAPREVRAPVPGVGARPRARPHVPEPPVRRAGRLAQAAPVDRDRDRQVPVGALRVDGRPRGGAEAGSARGPVPRVRVRHPGLRADRGADQGRQSRPPVGGRDRARREPDPGRAEEDRLHAEEPLLPLPGPRAARQGARGQGGAVHHHLRGAPAVHQQRRRRWSS